MENQEEKSALQQISEMIAGTGSKIDTTKPALEVKDYFKQFKKFVATKNVNFSVGHGVIHGFIGPNGAGKTTTIKAIIGAYIPTSGEILINGHKAGSIQANRLIGYIPESASFPGHLNTIDYLISMAKLSGLDSKVAKERSEQILDALGLSIHAKRKPKGFSSGMQKKILLAQSLLTDPKILVLDEPAANLDPTARKELFDQLIMLRNQGKTIIISSHILSELERLTDEVTFIYYGEIVYSGSVRGLTDGDSDVFIKSNDNVRLSKYLVEKGYKVSGDIKTEVEVAMLSREQINSLLENIVEEGGFTVLSFRSNDLQSVYDKLLHESKINESGNQTFSDEFTLISKIKKIFNKTKNIFSKRTNNVETQNISGDTDSKPQEESIDSNNVDLKPQEESIDSNNVDLKPREASKESDADVNL